MRFNLSELTNDKKKLLEWLNYDGNPPTVMVETAGSRARWGMRGSYASKKEEKKVIDEATLDDWWTEHRQHLSNEWAKVTPYKQQTHKQFLAECVRSMGIKGGTVEERIKKAIASRPDLYNTQEPPPADESFYHLTPPMDSRDSCPVCSQL
jgi:hypothetical protein